jgi:TonB family protein
MPNPFRTFVRAGLLAAALLVAAAPARAQAAAPARNEPDVQPVLLTRDLPRLTNRLYPRHLRAHPIPGSVDVRFKILENGRVDSTSVQIEVSSSPDFILPATQIALQLRFQPATLAGEPVPVWVTFPIHFGPWSDGTSTKTEQDKRMFPYHN